MNSLDKNLDFQIDNNLDFTTQNFESMDIISSEIVTKIGNKEFELNEKTILRKALNFRDLLTKKEEQNKILVYSENDDIVEIFAEIFSKVISNNKRNIVDLIEPKLNISRNLAINWFEKEQYDYCILFFKRNDKDGNYKIVFRKKDFSKISIEEEKQINQNRWIPNDIHNFVSKENDFNLINEEEINSFILSLKGIKNQYKIFSGKYAYFSENSDLEREIQLITNNSINLEKINLKKKTLDHKEERIFKILSMKKHKEKRDVIFFSSNKKDTIDVLVRRKKTFDKIDQNSLNLLFLNYLKETEKENFNKLNFFTSDFASNYVSKLLSKMNNKNLKYIDNFSTTKDEINTNENAFILTNDFLAKIEKSENNILKGMSDSSRMIVMIEMFDYYYSKNINIFNEIKRLEDIYTKEAIQSKSFYMSYDDFLKLINKLTIEKNVSGKRITRIKKENTINPNLRRFYVKITLEKNELITLEYDKLSSNLIVTTFLNTKNYDNSYKKAIFQEEKIFDYLSNFVSSADKSTASKIKSIVKISISISILCLTFLILFFTLYQPGAGKELSDTFSEIHKDFFSTNIKKTFTILLILSMFFPYFLNTILLKRITQKLKLKIKFRHLLISIFIGTFVTNITPFSFGGEIAGYWYLQKKGYEKAKIASAFFLLSLFYQVYVLISILILLPVAFHYYGDILSFRIDDPRIFFIFALVLIGVFSNLFTSFVIIVLTTFRKIQYAIVKMIVFFQKINPFNLLVDARRKELLLQIGYDKIKDGFVTLIKSPLLLLEGAILYKLPQTLFLASAFMVLMINPSIIGNPPFNSGNKFNQIWNFYWSFISGNALISLANNLSPLPGGVGTGDWLTVEIYNRFFSGENSELIKSEFLIANKLFFWVPAMTFSGFMLLTVWLGERRIDKYKAIESLISLNPSLAHKYKRTKTNYYWITTIIWFLVLAVGIAVLYLVL